MVALCVLVYKKRPKGLLTPAVDILTPPFLSSEVSHFLFLVVILRHCRYASTFFLYILFLHSQSALSVAKWSPKKWFVSIKYFVTASPHVATLTITGQILGGLQAFVFKLQVKKGPFAKQFFQKSQTSALSLLMLSFFGCPWSPSRRLFMCILSESCQKYSLRLSKERFCARRKRWFHEKQLRKSDFTSQIEKCKRERKRESGGWRGGGGGGGEKLVIRLWSAWAENCKCNGLRHSACMNWREVRGPHVGEQID